MSRNLKPPPFRRWSIHRLGGVGRAIGRKELSDILWLPGKRARGHEVIFKGIHHRLTSNAAVAGNRVSVSVENDQATITDDGSVG